MTMGDAQGTCREKAMGLMTILYGGTTTKPQTAERGFYPVSVATSRGDSANLECYRGQVLLIVNTASKCGFTRQYDGLEELYERYKDRGLLLLGFPSNDFAGQEPGSDAEIQEFCRINHGVTFPLFAKGHVRGPTQQEVFRILTTQGPRDLRGGIKWNFEKFLVGRDGSLVGRWRSYVSPHSASLIRAIERELAR